MIASARSRRGTWPIEEADDACRVLQTLIGVLAAAKPRARVLACQEHAEERRERGQNRKTQKGCGRQRNTVLHGCTACADRVEDAVERVERVEGHGGFLLAHCLHRVRCEDALAALPVFLRVLVHEPGASFQLSATVANKICTWKHG
eukprot:2029995-Rhodomonas_salina.1